MTSKIWEFNAMDTLFFRDGTPHNAGEGGGLGVKSIFPPYILTLQGAVRAGLAIGQDWSLDGDKPFPKELGDGDDLGKVSFEGPYLKYQDDYLFEVPLNLLHKDLREFSRVVPGEKYYETDIGRNRFPLLVKGIQGAKTMNNYLITGYALGRFLRGEDISASDFFNKSKLWSEEERTGIGIERTNRSTKQGMLYFTTHIRTKQNLAIVVKVKGISEAWHATVPQVLYLGGEGRMARVRISEDREIIPPMGEIKNKSDKIRFTVTLVTPGCCWPSDTIEDVTKETQDIIEKGYSFIPGNCVSACISKIKQVGGFDIKKREPRPLIPIIPPGSTWFYEGHSEDIHTLRSLHGKTSNSFGFNQIIIGNWGD